MKPKTVTLTFWLLAVVIAYGDGPANVPPVAPRGWSYYAFDDFETIALRPRWFVHNTDIALSGGRVSLTNRNGEDGFIALKGLYKVNEPRIFLQWPWAVETRMITEARESAAFNGGISMTVRNDGGWSGLLDIGQIAAFGGSSVYYSVEGKRVGLNASWAGNALDRADSLSLRVEGVGEDQRTVRLGVKAAPTDPWIWSPEIKLSQPVTYAQPISLRNGRLFNVEPTGDRVTVSFEYARFEGTSFQPGILHASESEFLEKLSKTQHEELRKAGLSIDYVRPHVPEVRQPEFNGSRYEAHIPDTLDLAERAALSLNALTEVVDPTADYEPYCHIYANPKGWNHYGAQYNPDIERQAPVMTHDFHGYNTGIGEGWIEDMPLLRLASGSTQNLEVSQKMFDNMRRMIGDDGLPRFPLRGRPWALFVGWWIDDPLTGRSADQDLTMTGGFAWGRFLSSLASWYAASGKPQLKEEIEKMVVAFSALIDTNPNRPLASPIEYGVVQAYRVTKFPRARDLAARMLAETRRRKFGSDGSFQGHFHDTTFRILSMAQLAALTDDRELLGFAKKAYEFARTQGSPLVGFYPEAVGQNPATQETCALSHMPGIAAILSLAGMGDYWDDIDRLVRNQLVENQMTDSDWLYAMAKEIPPYGTPTPQNYDGVRNVGKRLLGSFAAYASVNDFFMPFNRAPGPMVGCCTGNGARALYYVWEHILHERKGSLYVNLLLNRASKWADVDSYLPYEGRVDVKMKTPELLFVRMPEWVDLSSVRCLLDGRPTSVSWHGRYAAPGDVPSGKLVTFQFPISERTVRQRIGTVDATLVLKGSTVVDINPEGRYRPLYKRAQYRGPTRWKNVVRFAPDQNLEW